MDTTLNTYSWNFGDASSSGSGYATSHTYASTGMYYVVLKVASTLGCMDSTIDSFAILITGIENISNSNHVSVYPNPFREKATIEYILNKPSQVKIDISDIFGREVATLVNTYTNAGEYTFTFNASRYNMLTAGVYIIKINIGDHVTTQRITLLK